MNNKETQVRRPSRQTLLLSLLTSALLVLSPEALLAKGLEGYNPEVKVRSLVKKIETLQDKFNKLGRSLFHSQNVHHSRIKTKSKDQQVSRYLHAEDCFIGTALIVTEQVGGKQKVVSEQMGPIDLRRIDPNKITLKDFVPGENYGYEIDFDQNGADLPNLYFAGQSERAQALQMIQSLNKLCLEVTQEKEHLAAMIPSAEVKACLDSQLLKKFSPIQKIEQSLVDMETKLKNQRVSAEKAGDVLPIDTNKLGTRPIRRYDEQTNRMNIALLTDGDHALQARMKLLDQPNEVGDRIQFQHLITMADEAGRGLSDQLIEKAGKGVQTEVIVDALSAYMDVRDSQVRSNTKRMYNNLMASGVPVYGYRCSPISFGGRLKDELYNAIRFKDFDAANQRAHEKFTIVHYGDAKNPTQYGIMGGRNVGNDYMGINEQGYGFWRDQDVVARGDTLVNDMDLIFKGNIQTYHHNFIRPISQSLADIYALPKAEQQQAVQTLRAGFVRAFDLKGGIDQKGRFSRALEKRYKSILAKRQSGGQKGDSCFNPFHPVAEKEFYERFKKDAWMKYDDSRLFKSAAAKDKHARDSVSKLKQAALSKSIDELFAMNKVEAARIVQSVPKRGHELHLDEAYVDMIDRAQDKIIISNAYFIPSARIRKALQDAAMRGVQVTVLSNSLEANDVPPVAYVSRDRYKSLIDPGLSAQMFGNKQVKPIQIYEWTGKKKGDKKMSWGTNHGKWMIVDPDPIVQKDGKTLYRAQTLMGSYNLDPRSRDYNSEVALIYQDGAEQQKAGNSLTTQLYKHFLEHDLSFAEPVKYSDMVDYARPISLQNMLQLNSKHFLGKKRSFGKMLQDGLFIKVSEQLEDTI